MKKIKKFAGVMLGLCMCLLVHTITVNAAEGTLMFSDPETKTGEEVGVVLKAQTGGDIIGDVHVVMQYDPSMLEFVEGTDVTSSGEGQLEYSSFGSGDSTEASTTIYFKALKQGEADITVVESTAYLYSDEILYLSDASSKITIAEGTTTAAPADSEGVAVTVDGKKYTFSESFPDTEIPENYKKTKLQYNGAERTFVTNDSGAVNLGYLVDESGNGAFFLYDQDNATFSPYVQVALSDSRFMVLLNNTDNLKLPKKYTAVTITYNDVTFPAWSDTTAEGFYVVYGMNDKGEKNFYQYDEQEGTFQRTVIEEEKVEKKDTSLIGKIKNKIGNFVDTLFIGLLVIAALLLLFLIVALVKLNHRNLELDDWYEEYGSAEEKAAVKKQKKKEPVKKKSDYNDQDDYRDDYDDDYYYDDDDDYYDNDDTDDYYDQDDYDDSMDFDDQDDYDDEADDYYYDDDDDYDDSDDESEIDFIDL